VLSFVPPFTPILMPVRIALGHVSPWEIALAVLALLRHSSETFISSGGAEELTLSDAAAQTLREATSAFEYLQYPSGQVRLRKGASGGAWGVDLFPPACRLAA
jgi:hypothetical protein